MPTAGFCTGDGMQQELEAKLKKMIVESLMLEDVKPEDIDSEAALFVEGLGLDSIDALELAIAIDNTFGVRIKADDENTRETFRNVRSLADYLSQQLSKNGAA